MVNKEYLIDTLRWIATWTIRWILLFLITGAAIIAGLTLLIIPNVIIKGCAEDNKNVNAVVTTDEPKKMWEIGTINQYDRIYQTTVDQCQYLVALTQSGTSIVHKQNCNNPQHLKEEKNDVRYSQILEHD